MGFAKYQEDIVNRYVGDLAMRSVKAPVSPPKPSSPNAKNQPDQRTKKMSSLKKFAVATPRPLPVIVLADTSGSMGENGKIGALNAAMKDMVSTFAKESRLRAEIQVGLITFGGKAQVHLPLAGGPGGPAPRARLHRNDVQALLTKGLSRAERLILILYYYEEMTMKEIGLTLDLSESRVSQMHSSIIMRLKAQMKHRIKEL